MQTTHLRRPITFLLCLLYTLTVCGAPEAKISKTPSWVILRSPDLNKQPKEKEIDNGVYLCMYDEQVNVNEKTRYKHFIKKITNESGIQSNSELSFSFSSAYQQIYFHEISINRFGQRINKLNKSQIKVLNDETSLYDHQLTGTYSALLILEDLRKGDILEVAYSVIGENPIYNDIYSDRFVFASYVPITNYYSSIIMPKGRKLNYKCYNNAKEPVIIPQTDNTIYDWPVMQFEAFDFSGSTPGWFTDYPCVEVSEYNNWEEVAKWALGVVDNYKYTLTANLQEKIHEWNSTGATSTGAFAEKATRFVQDEIRYMGMEIGVNSHKPHLPSETFNKRYGDCKDKSMLLVALFRSQNIPASLALVSTSFRSHLAEHIPSPGYFDHAIVKATIDGKDIMIDPTISLQRGSISNTQCPDYGQAIIVAPGTKYSEKLPLQSYSFTDITEVYTIPENNKSRANLEVVTIYKDASADNTRSMFSTSSLKNIEEYYEDYYRSTFDKIKLTTSVTHDDDSDANTITVNEAYAIDSIWKSSNKVEYIPVQARVIYERLSKPDEKHADKPLAQTYPLDIKYTAVLNMPSDWSFSDKGFSIETSSYSFRFEPVVSGKKVTLEYSFKTFKDHIPAEEIAQYEKDYEKIIAVTEYNMTYNKGLMDKIGAVNERGLTAKTNWIAVFICLICMAGIFFLMRHFNAKESLYTSHIQAPESINGWIVLLGIVLAIRIALYLYAFLTGGYLKTESWMMMNELGETGMQLLLMIEMISMVCFLVYSCWLMYWFIKKRDVFPRMFIIFALSELCINFCSLLIGLLFKDKLESIAPNFILEAGKSLTRSVFFVAIWVSAVYRSEKVKQIFIRPYKYKDEEVNLLHEPAMITTGTGYASDVEHAETKPE